MKKQSRVACSSLPDNCQIAPELFELARALARAAVSRDLAAISQH